MHFVSNVDEADLVEAIKNLDRDTTLFIVASKTFTTQETMTNALSARDWFLAEVKDREAIAKHFVAVSTNAEKVEAFGIDTQEYVRVLGLGGRALFPVVGHRPADCRGRRHGQLSKNCWPVRTRWTSISATAPLERNIPVIMGLLGIWYNNFFGAQTQAILPYDQYLDFLADHLQQADMESNGKSVDIDGRRLDYDTGPVIFGQAGTNGQHAFYQLIHQGSKLVPCDFLAAAHSHHKLAAHHEALLSNFIAQTEALMRGKTTEEARAELIEEGVPEDRLDRLAMAKTFPGNKPSNSFLYHSLTPETLGALVAFYEHKVFVQGAIWNINSFDQMGVELGKQLAKTVLKDMMDDELVDSHDSSTNGLLNYYKSLR